jgi:hypothetical protein
MNYKDKLYSVLEKIHNHNLKLIIIKITPKKIGYN